MKKIVVPAVLLLLCFTVLSVDAQPKKIALIGRISWSPGGANQSATDDTDFDVMVHFSMDDEMLRYKVTQWGYFPILMPDFVVQMYLSNGKVPFPVGDDADYRAYVNEGDYMNQPTFFQDQGYQLVYNTGTCWSNIGPPLKDIPVPVIQGEHANLGMRAKIGAMGMFEGEGSGDIAGVDTIILTDAGKKHPLTAGLPNEIKIFGDGPKGPPENPGAAWAGIYENLDAAAPGTEILAIWSGDGNDAKVAIAVMEKGGLYADNTPAPARRVMMFWTGQVRPQNDADPTSWLNVMDYMTKDGQALILRSIQWALGETPTPVGKWTGM